MIAVIKVEIIMFDCHVSSKPFSSWYIPRRYDEKSVTIGVMIGSRFNSPYHIILHICPQTTEDYSLCQTIRDI